MQKALFVFALLLVTKDKLLLVWKSKKDGKWRLPGGAVPADMEERAALVPLTAKFGAHCVEVVEQIGPMHQMPEGPARAYDCEVTNQAHPSELDPDVDDFRFVTLHEFQNLDVDEGHKRAALDGFSVMQTPEIDDIPEALVEHAPVEGIFVSDDQRSLIEITSDDQRTYQRIGM